MISKKDEFKIPGSIQVIGNIDKRKVLDQLLKRISKEKDERDELKDIDNR